MDERKLPIIEKVPITLEDIDGAIEAGFSAVEKGATLSREKVITLNLGDLEGKVVKTLKEELKKLLRDSTSWDDYNRRMNEYHSGLYKKFAGINSAHLRGIVTSVDRVMSDDTNMSIFRYFKNKAQESK